MVNVVAVAATFLYMLTLLLKVAAPVEAIVKAGDPFGERTTLPEVLSRFIEPFPATYT